MQKALEDLDVTSRTPVFASPTGDETDGSCSWHVNGGINMLGNMYQPFWSLPLLGLMGLRARDIMGFCLILFLVCLPVLGIALWLGIVILIRTGLRTGDDRLEPFRRAGLRVITA